MKEYGFDILNRWLNGIGCKRGVFRRQLQFLFSLAHNQSLNGNLILRPMPCASCQSSSAVSIVPSSRRTVANPLRFRHRSFPVSPGLIKSLSAANLKQPDFVE
jgi:hypothetical protein